MFHTGIPKSLKMKTAYVRLTLGALFVACLSITACTNQDGAAGSSDGNSGEAYELRSEDHLVPSMDSVGTSEKTTPDSSGTSNGE